MASKTPRQQVLVNTTDVRKLADNLKIAHDRAIAEIVYTLKYIGEQAVTIAREGGTYNDITGNLRSSVGYVVLVDGKPEGGLTAQYQQIEGKAGDGAKGLAAAKGLLRELQGKYSRGVALIIVAGMNYAAYVENVRHRVVLSEARLIAEQLVNQLLQPFIK